MSLALPLLPTSSPAAVALTTGTGRGRALVTADPSSIAIAFPSQQGQHSDTRRRERLLCCKAGRRPAAAAAHAQPLTPGSNDEDQPGRRKAPAPLVTGWPVPAVWRVSAPAWQEDLPLPGSKKLVTLSPCHGLSGTGARRNYYGTCADSATVVRVCSSERNRGLQTCICIYPCI